MACIFNNLSDRMDEKWGAGHVKINKELYLKISNINKQYDKKGQKAALLERNKLFIAELNNLTESFPDLSNFLNIKKRYPDGLYVYAYTYYNLNTETRQDLNNKNPLIRLKYSKYKHKNWITRENKLISGYHTIIINNKNIYPFIQELEYRAGVFNLHLKQWKTFCNRWLINDDWDGTLGKICQHLRNPTEIYYDNGSLCSFEEKGKWAFFLRINAWTTLNDIKDKWKIVELIQKRILGKYESRPNFGRDLSWYDLKYIYSLSSKQIVELWEKSNPRDIDLLAIKRIKAKEKSELGPEKEAELLAKIKSDPRLTNLREEFEVERESYVGGKYPLLIDIVKKAIKRMERLIIQIKPQEGNEEYITIQRAIEQTRGGKQGLIFKKY